MSFRIRNIAIALIIGCLTTLIIVYTFTLASSIGDRQGEMSIKLSQYGVTSYEGPENFLSPFLLFVIGAVMTLFTGGIVATMLAKTDGLPRAEWLDSSVVAAVIPVIAVCAKTLIGWSDSARIYADQYGRPVEPSPFIMVIFILVIYCAVIFMASAAGGVLVALSKKYGN